MLFKYLKESKTPTMIAVNPNNVAQVRELNIGCRIVFIDGKHVDVLEGFMDVATKLSEK